MRWRFNKKCIFRPYKKATSRRSWNYGWNKWDECQRDNFVEMYRLNFFVHCSLFISVLLNAAFFFNTLQVWVVNMYQFKWNDKERNYVRNVKKLNTACVMFVSRLIDKTSNTHTHTHTHIYTHTHTHTHTHIYIYIYIYISDNHHHHHHIVLAARISLTLFRHSSLSFIALGRSSGQQPVSSHSCWMYVRAGRPAFARPCVGIHKSTSLMSSSLLLQQCPACLVRLTWIVFVIGGRWPYSWCLVGCCCQDLLRIARSILV